MRELTEWYKAISSDERPWLILGKGPSFNLRRDFDLTKFRTFGLNHVVREQKLFVSHIIDIDVVNDCAEEILSNAQYLVMPNFPHLCCETTDVSLSEFVSTHPVLQQLESEERLVWYNLCTAPPVGTSPLIKGWFFSGTVAVNMLGTLGASKVYSLGIDGGSTYSRTFDDLSDKTLLTNGAPSFDVQFSYIKKSTEELNMTFERLVEPIRVFVGCDDSQMAGAYVLEHSIRKHTKHPVEVFFMQNAAVRAPRDTKNRPGTGFSFNRFTIPALAGNQGKAIYVDADMLVFDDIAKLWNLPMNGKSVLCSYFDGIPEPWKNGGMALESGREFKAGRQLSVMLLDCEKLDWDVGRIVDDLDAGRYTYRELMADLSICRTEEIGDTIPETWNSLEYYDPDQTQLLHFTVVPHQPWKNKLNALRDIWLTAYREAVADGAVPEDVIVDAVNRRLIAPDLLDIYQSVASRNSDRSGQPDDCSESETTNLRMRLWKEMSASATAQQELDSIKSTVLWKTVFLPYQSMKQLPHTCKTIVKKAIGRKSA